MVNRPFKWHETFFFVHIVVKFLPWFKFYFALLYNKLSPSTTKEKHSYKIEAPQRVNQYYRQFYLLKIVPIYFIAHWGTKLSDSFLNRH